MTTFFIPTPPENREILVAIFANLEALYPGRITVDDMLRIETNVPELMPFLRQYAEELPGQIQVTFVNNLKACPAEDDDAGETGEDQSAEPQSNEFSTPAQVDQQIADLEKEPDPCEKFVHAFGNQDDIARSDHTHHLPYEDFQSLGAKPSDLPADPLPPTTELPEFQPTPSTNGKKKMTFRGKKDCIACGKQFTPSSGNQMRCDDCRDKNAASQTPKEKGAPPPLNTSEKVYQLSDGAMLSQFDLEKMLANEDFEIGEIITRIESNEHFLVYRKNSGKLGLKPKSALKQ